MDGFNNYTWGEGKVPLETVLGEFPISAAKL